MECIYKPTTALKTEADHRPFLLGLAMDLPENAMCPLCGRLLVPGRSINLHHLVPKTFGGKESYPIHKICHSKIHSLFTERELLKVYHTWETLKSHPEIEKFVRWVARKDPEYNSSNRRSQRRKR